jgi:hypothetical protein
MSNQNTETQQQGTSKTGKFQGKVHWIDDSGLGMQGLLTSMAIGWRRTSGDPSAILPEERREYFGIGWSEVNRRMG